ncbi:MAG: hypothetical protein GWP91_14825 [Rhodobacterales bacterium]|nr:hypothetical protein [Rhodobacterales bacterium]
MAGSAATYRCAVSLAQPYGTSVQALGEVRGVLVAARGTGPGLEPCFLPNGAQDVLSQRVLDERALHHRVRALDRLLGAEGFGAGWACSGGSKEKGPVSERVGHRAIVCEDATLVGGVVANLIGHHFGAVHRDEQVVACADGAATQAAVAPLADGDGHGAGGVGHHLRRRAPEAVPPWSTAGPVVFELVEGGAKPIARTGWVDG